MKKLFSFLMLFVALFACQSVFVSCDKDNDDDYYAGESEADYKPAVYTITSTWDLSKVDGLTSEQKSALEKELTDTVTASETFNSRAEAVAAFDEIVIEMKNDSDFAIAGMKCTLYLKRGSATIKSANLQW